MTGERGAHTTPEPDGTPVPSPLVPAGDHDLVVGVDVGGSKVLAVAFGRGGAVTGRARRPMELRDGRARIEPVIDAIRACVEQAGEGTPGAVGIGAPGRVDAQGCVRGAVNLGWEAMPLAALVGEALGVLCAAGNDAHLAARGLIGSEHAAGAASFAYVGIGTGIGAGLVLDGRPYRGPDGLAGEIGHVVVEPHGAPCACGRRGCLETIASGPAIARSYGQAAGGQTADARQVFAAAGAGDPRAVATVEQAAAAIARVLADLALVLGLQRVLLGGGVADAGQTLLAPIRAELDRQRSASPLLAGLLAADAVRPVPSTFEAAARGAALLARELPSP